MKPIFTLHAGEFLAGDYIERNFRHVNLWVPAKDTGIDFLVTDKKNKNAVSLQIKFSRDYGQRNLNTNLRASGWFKLERRKIASSVADYWVFVLFGLNRKETAFVIIPPRELLKRLDGIHGKNGKFIHTYLWVTEERKCWEGRGLGKREKTLIDQNKFRQRMRDFTKYLNVWTPIQKLNRG
ncbi:MAG: hypothetical protein KC643_19645 [Nitrospira sp.]|nr:hypothetical protein [Nitrospira sp.]